MDEDHLLPVDYRREPEQETPLRSRTVIELPSVVPVSVIDLAFAPICSETSPPCTVPFKLPERRRLLKLPLSFEPLCSICSVICRA